ncbi:hypothetical protein [Spirosoma endophyticum]|uniref:Uncharacterized protein n=1 Tax=Spirosoma endophyticum TaxID=662367 RepID=A0A1I2BVA2_9BACT|nr:hypothetical protein [Spirosoma endophyticum]SFE59984.1 hypothetical protein SAMN05216167_11619 [Spirosoma endophyticum]
MRQASSILLFIVAGIICFSGYCMALIDWVQDARTGVYESNYTEAVLETSALVIYTYLAMRFLNRKIPFL